jgi:hypothetical protein
MTTTGALRPALVGVLREEFGDDPLALALFHEFLAPGGLDPARAGRLAAVARARGVRASWELRRAAALMLETVLFALPDDDAAGHEAVLRAVCVGSPGGRTFPPGPSVLAEGYTTTDPAGFVKELRARLARHARVHRRLDGPDTTPEALRDFLDLARHEPKLTLARDLFTPAEVAGRVLGQVRTSRGLYAPFHDPLVAEEADALAGEWPDYERAVLRELLAGSRVFWVGDATPGRVNALVEYPLGTVVLAVKPPGSDVEFELKRAGRRGGTPLSVVYDGDGGRVCSTHRLDGGSMAPNLRAEAGGAAAFSRLFRLIHGRRAPVSLTLSHRNIHEVPCRGGRADLLGYFTEPEVFGPGFGVMREALARSVESFAREWGSEPLDAPGDLGATVAFLAQVNPSQAVLGPSSAFRLDLVASYLADDGPDRYFRRGLGEEFTPGDARRFAEALLDEALGCVRPPRGAAPDHTSYIRAVFADAANRRRAGATFLDLASQTGDVWGTLYGLKGFSFGESFVGRNVGLRAVWEGGAWQVRLIFMDHDLLIIPRERFEPGRALWGASVDATYLLFDPPSGRRCELDLLATIYRADAKALDLGRAALLNAARAAYRRTRQALETDPEVRALYRDDCLAQIFAFDDALAAYARARRRGETAEGATRIGADVLRGLGLGPEADAFPEAVARRDDFLTRCGWLYDADDPRASATGPTRRRPRARPARVITSSRRGPE